MVARTPKFAKAMSGFVLLEAAVAFILVSIGMIGLMMLSVKGSRASQESFERTVAVNLATQIAVKVRTAGDGLLEWHGVDVANSGTWISTNPATLVALNELSTIAADQLASASARVTLRASDGLSACAAPPCEVMVDVAWTGASRQLRSYALYSWAGVQ